MLEWLKPASQVIGWEHGVDESEFVGQVSLHGHMMLPADWSYNLGITSRNYTDRQTDLRINGIDPTSIDYDAPGNYCSFFLTDGDNYQWIMGDGFVNDYYSLSSSAITRTAFGVCSESLVQLAPTRFKYLLEQQPSEECTLMETFGGGYYYIDNFATKGRTPVERAEIIKVVAERTAAHMRKHSIKILQVIAMDLTSPNGHEMLQAFVDANDELEGIVAIQYAPYNGGAGKVYWFTNKAGYDIPCITTKYMLWDGISSPSDAATQMTAQETAETSYSTITIHAWSTFEGKRGSDAAAMCANKLPSTFKTVSMQELVWRLRMSERREQTRNILNNMLLNEARALAADKEAVAIGKLINAIADFEMNGDETALKTAIVKFKEDNADIEEDMTDKVATNKWKKYDGSSAGVCSTAFAPSVTTYDGRTSNLAEVYETTTNTIGNIIYQDVKGLPNGAYHIGLYGNALYTNGRGFDSPMSEGANDIAYVFANDEKLFFPAHIGTATKKNGYHLLNVEINGENLRIGIGKAKAGTNWHTIQIHKLTKYETAKDVYAKKRDEMSTLIMEAEALAGNSLLVNDKTIFVEAISTAHDALENNTLNIQEFVEAINALKNAIDSFKESNKDIITGVGTVKIKAPHDVKRYNLQGVPINNSNQKGILIENERKILLNKSH